MLSCRRASVKGFCKDFCLLFKIVKTNRKTQEICSFNLQTAGVLGQTKSRPARWGQGSLQKALIFSFCAGHPLPPTADTSDTAPPQWRAESPEYSIFTQQAGKRTGDDIAVGIVQKVEIGIQWFIQEVNRQGRAKQKKPALAGHGGRWGGSLSPQAEPGRAPAGHGC